MTTVPVVLLAAALLSAPLAKEPPLPAEQAATPADPSDLPFFSARRLRLSVGVSYAHLPLTAPGGNSLGGGATLAFEGRYLEGALSLYGHGGFAAQDAHARHTGPATSYLRGTLRVAPFPAWTRVMLEAGGQLGWDSAWAWCTNASGTDRCGVVPARLSWGGVAGVVVLVRAKAVFLSVGLDAVLRGPQTPGNCGAASCPAAPIGAAGVGLQAWLEAGFGGVSW